MTRQNQRMPSDRYGDNMATAPQPQSGDFEPLLIPTLRILIALPLVASTIPLTLQWFLPAWFAAVPWIPDHVQAIPSVFLFFQGLALALLFLPRFQQTLGKWFLPLVILLSTLGLLGGMLSHFLALRAAADQIANQFADIPYAYSIWPPAFFALIPMVVVAWQYNFRDVLLYAFTLVAAELLIIVALFWGTPGTTFTLLVAFAVFRTIVFVSTGYLVSQLVTSQRLQRAELVRVNRQLASHALTQQKLAVSQERNRLARDLHDTLAHYLSGLVLELEGTRLLWDSDEEKARRNLDESIDTARSGLMETRRALKALRAAPLDDLGLIGAVRELAQNSTERNQWQLCLEMPDALPSMPPAAESTLYRIAQEALTNIERHAQAHTVRIRLTHEQDDAVLVIADDGVGYRATEVSPAEHFGLSGMAERAEMVGGTLTIDSRQGAGTRVSATIPLGHASARHLGDPAP